MITQDAAGNWKEGWHESNLTKVPFQSGDLVVMRKTVAYPPDLFLIVGQANRGKDDIDRLTAEGVGVYLALDSRGNGHILFINHQRKRLSRRRE
jgi:hypothetical protein